MGKSCPEKSNSEVKSMPISKGLIVGCLVFILWAGIYFCNLRHFLPIVSASNDIIFHADTIDTVEDMGRITFNGDAKKHLLFSAVTASAVKVIKEILSLSESNAIILVLAVIAACNITLAYINLIYFLQSVSMALWFSTLYGLSFSNLVIFSIPETYSLSNIFILCYILVSSKMRYKSSLYLSVISGVIAGMSSLFNPPLLSLIVMRILSIARLTANAVRKVGLCLVCAGIAGIIYILPTLLIQGRSYFEFSKSYLDKYASFGNFMSLEKVGNVLAGFIFYSVITPVNRLADDIPIGALQNYFFSLPKLILLGIYITMMGWGIWKWCGTNNKRDFLGIWFLFMLCFYIYFNPLEAILYSSQVTFPIIMFISWTFMQIRGEIKYYVLMLFMALLALQNFGTLYAPLK